MMVRFRNYNRVCYFCSIDYYRYVFQITVWGDQYSCYYYNIVLVFALFILLWSTSRTTSASRPLDRVDISILTLPHKVTVHITTSFVV